MFKTIDEQIEYLESLTARLLREKLDTPDKKRQYSVARERLEELRAMWLDIDEHKLPQDPYYDLEEKVSYHPKCMDCDCFPAGSKECKNKPECEEEDISGRL